MGTMYRVVAVAGLIAAGSLLGTTVGAQATDHCPDHQGHPGKVENVNSPSQYFAEGTDFCVKAGTFATGIITNWGGGTYTTPSEWHPLGKEPIDISYYIVYSEPGNGNGTDPGNGNGTEPDNGNGTDPDNGNGNGTEPDNGNGTDPDNGTEPEVTEPEVTEPEVTEPEVTEPETGQLPPPGTDEPATVPATPEPVQLPPTPEVAADPPPAAAPPAAAPEVTALPHTGATSAVLAAFGLALLTLGVGLRRFAR